VCPGRTHSMVVYQSRDHFIVAAGDHMGNIGLWSVKEPSTAASVTAGAIDSSTAFHLVQPHQGLVSCLQWTPTTGCLFSSSYDGTVSWFHAATEQFDCLLPLHSSPQRALIMKPTMGVQGFKPLDTPIRMYLAWEVWAYRGAWKSLMHHRRA
jgi:WD40 repeat protein